MAEQQIAQTEKANAHQAPPGQIPAQARNNIPQAQYSAAFEKAIDAIGPYDFNPSASVDRGTVSTMYFLGDYHHPKYREGLAKAIDYLIQNADVRSVGIEGLWGEPREEMLNDRYKLLERILGKEETARWKEGEKGIYGPIEKLISQKVKHGEVQVEAYGLETKNLLAISAFVVKQHNLATSLLIRLNEIEQKSPGKELSEIFGEGGDEKAIALESQLLQLSERVAADEEMNTLIPRDVPRYSREVLNSPRQVMTYQLFLNRASSKYVFTARDVAARNVTNELATKEGNSAFTMGWMHVVNVPLNVKQSALVVHPILKNDPLRAEFDKRINNILNPKKGRE